jgi:predicted acyltransferase
MNDNTDKTSLLKKVFKRALIIFGVGLFLNWFPFYNKHVSDLRIFGVLQRIAMAFFFGSIIIIYVKEKWLMFVAICILVFYYLLLIYGVDTGQLDLMTNLVRKLDLLILGENHLYNGYTYEGNNIPFDPEGILSTLGSIGNVLFGYIISKKIKDYNEESSKIKSAVLFGLLLVILGILWNYFNCPINKPIWSGSYAMLTSGLCSILFAIMIYIIDFKKLVKWSFPFKVFGMNALASYALSGLVVKIMSIIRIGNENIFSMFYKNVTSAAFGLKLGSLVSAILYCFLIWSFAYILYKKKIFIKA